MPLSIDRRAVDGWTTVLTIDGQRYTVDIVRDGRTHHVTVDGEVYRFAPDSGSASSHSVGSGDMVDGGQVLIVLAYD